MALMDLYPIFSLSININGFFIIKPNNHALNASITHLITDEMRMGLGMKSDWRVGIVSCYRK